MGAPGSGMEAANQPAAAALADAFKTISEEERARHQAVLDYWLSIRGNRELPPLRDLDPLEISDAAPDSLLVELIGGGEDAEIRHIGETLKAGTDFDKISAAPRPSILASIARKLSIVAISRNFVAFEDEFPAGGAVTRCWVTMVPLSSAGAWVDYVYAFVTFDSVEGQVSVPEPVDEPAAVPVEAEAAAPEEDVLELDSPVETADEPVEAVAEIEVPAPEPEEPAPAPKSGTKDASFSFDASSGGFYAKAVKVQPTLPVAAPSKGKAVRAEQEAPPPPAPAMEEAPPVPQPAEPDLVEAEDEVQSLADLDPIEEVGAGPEEIQPAASEKPQKSTSAAEGTLQSKLTEVRAKADEARAAKLRANVALYEGLGAAYDFALDAEDSPEEYLKIVEAKGLKIQLRSPMRPVVKLAFEGMCDDSTIAQLEAVLAWALDQELPRGSLAKCIEEAGGIGPIINGQAKAA